MTANKVKFDVIRIHGIAMGVGVIDKTVKGGTYSESVCETLYVTGDDEKDAANSEKWARTIVKALNKYYHQ